jgi:general secretion pathway protein N
MPLEGDQAGWTLVEVRPRSVVFQSAANEKTEIELETSVAPPPRASPPRNSRSSPNQRGTTSAGSADNKRDSGDLARRIEERRRQMREDAEKQRNQNGKGKPPPKPPAPPKQ